jgi:hypothetical protein
MTEPRARLEPLLSRGLHRVLFPRPLLCGSADREWVDFMNYTVVEVNPSDHREEIVKLWAENFPDLGDDRFHWAYENSPDGRARCWLLYCEGGAEPVGATVLFQRHCRVRGELKRAATAGDFSVLSQHRSFRPALTLLKQSLSAVSDTQIDCVVTLPNLRSAPVGLRAGYVKVGDQVRGALFLDTTSKLRRLTRSGAVASALAPIANMALRIYRNLSAPRIPARYRGVELSFSDERLSALAEQAASWIPILIDRTSSHLSWRFGEAPSGGFRIWGLEEQGSKDLVGYVVYHVDSGEVSIDDVLARSPGPPLIALINGFLQAQQKLRPRLVSVSYYGAPALTDVLRAHGFSIETMNSPVMVITAPNSPVREMMGDSGNWWLFRFDQDI